MSTPPRVLLIGMMGAGKSTVGSQLARQLGWDYLDSDEEVISSTGHSIPEIWRSRGEQAFRAEEARVLAEALANPRPVVISVAGGAVLDPRNRERIRGAGLVVWLRAEVATLAARVGAGEGRPLLDVDPAAALARLLAVRAPVYEELAQAIVDVDKRTPKDIVEQLARLVSDEVQDA